jgi:hypothetical protein
MSERTFAVEVVVVGTATVAVRASCPDEARDLAEQATTPLHATNWTYDADRILHESAEGSEAITCDLVLGA